MIILIGAFVTMLCACGKEKQPEKSVTLNKEDTTISFCVDEILSDYPIQIPEFQSKCDSSVVKSMNNDITDLLMPVYEQKDNGKKPCIITEIYDNNRYLQAVCQYAVYPLDGKYEKVVSYNYDRIQDKKLTLTDALIASGTTLDDVRQLVNDYFVHQYEDSENEIAIYGVTVDGFVMNEDDSCIYYGNVCIGNDAYTLYIYAFDFTTKEARLYDKP